MSSLWLDHGHAMHFIYISVSWYACSFSCTFVRLTRYRIVRWCPLYTCLTRNFPEPQGEDLQDRPPPHIDRQRTARNATGGQKKNRIRRKQIKHAHKKCQFLSMLLSLTFLSRVCLAFGWSKCQNLFQAATWQQCEDFVLRMLSILIQPNNTMLER